MKLLDLRETFSRIIFWFHNIRYVTKKHHMMAVLMLVLIMLIIFTSVFISQKNRLERKENILKSFYEVSDEKDEEDHQSALNDEPVLIIVHVCGEVKNPGVYEIQKGSRVIDLIEKAGGAAGDACTDSLNLAREVIDGQRIYVPSEEEAESGVLEGPAAGDNGYSLIININTASQGQLENLPGIGPVTAEKIIQYRSTNGSFTRKEDLLDVSGIGPKKFEDIKDLIDI
jgi:competence protein ComEA